MADLESLKDLDFPIQARLMGPLVQGGVADLFGELSVLDNEDPPRLRFTWDPSSSGRQGSLALSDEHELYLGLGSRLLTLRASLVKLESGSRALFQAEAIVEAEQRREFFRVPADFTVQLVPVQEDSQHHLAQIVSCEDLSGGGMLIRTRTFFTPGQRLLLHLDLPEAERPLQCEAKVVRSNKVLKSEDGTYATAIQFKGLKREVLDAIMGFCFAKQREQRRELVAVREPDALNGG